MSRMFWPALTLTLISAASMALEIVAGRALAPYVGMSLYSWTVIIAVVLAGLSLGHWVGGMLADGRFAPARLVALILTGAAGSAFLSLFILRHVEPLIFGADPITHVSALALAAFFTPSVLAGALSPILTRMALDAFFIGGGAYTLPRAWLARYPQARLTTAEIDPDVTRVAHDRLWLPEDPRHEVIHQDARLALAGMAPERRFDVIFGDAFHDISIPQHLATDEFHAAVAARLKPGGLYVLNVIDALRAPRFLLSLATTLKRRFAHVELWQDIAAIGPEEARVTWIVLASDRATGRRSLRATYGVRREWVQAPLDGMTRAVGPERLVTLTDDFAPVDRLLAHVLLSKTLAESE